MFGTSVSRRQLTVTDDYPADKRFEHLPVADEIVRGRHALDGGHATGGGGG